MLPFEKKDLPKTLRERAAANQQTSQQFYFGPQNIRYIGKRTGRLLRPSDHNSTFLKLQGLSQTQDYLIVAKQELSSFSEIPRQSDQSFSQIQTYKQPDSSKTIQNGQSRVQKDSPILQIQQQAKTKIEDKTEIEANTEIEPNQNLDKNGRNSTERCYAVVQNSPFFVQNLSNVKSRYSGGGRKSQEFLLQLLRSEKKVRHHTITPSDKPGGDQELQQIKEEQVKEFLNLKKQNKDQGKKRQSLNIQNKKQKQSKQRPKTKRVTINDKGKIKLPTDSFSLDFNTAKPSQMGQHFSQIQEKQEEWHKQQQIDAQVHRSWQNREELYNYRQSEATKQEERRKSTSPKLNSKKNSKAKSSKSGKNKLEQNRQERLIKKRKIEDRMGLREQNIISERVDSALNPNTGRPIRTKRQPTDFHKNQKTLYNGKNEVVMTGISTQMFLQMLGFTVHQQIKNSSTKYGSNYMWHMFRMRPKQQICSIGVDQEKIKKHLKPLANFDKMWISPQKAGSRWLQIKIDNFQQQILDKQFLVERDQRVQIRNISQNKCCNIVIGLQRPANSKQKQY